jgi:DNA modification methylase
MAWESRITGHGEAAPADLVGNPRNWRTHPQAQRDALAGVLDEVGWVQDVIVNKRTGYLVDGHARVAVAAQRGEASVPVVYVDLSEDEERLILATLDPLSAMAEADDDALADLLAAVTAEDGALAEMLEALAPLAPVDGSDTEAGEPADEPYVKLGDVWQVGEHRIMCGDSTDAEDVARLLGGETPLLMVTDPPYGVEYDPEWRDAVNYAPNRRRGVVPNDDQADWSAAWKLSPSEVAYCWAPGGAQHIDHGRALIAAGFELRYEIIWSKPQHSFGRGHYHWQHEPLWCGVRAGAQAHWIGDRKQTTVWEIEPVRANRAQGEADAATDHGTQKPVECMERPIRNHEGDVYDPFLGSGTTAIAAANRGRKCYGMEISPAYAQVSIERLAAHIGDPPERVE